MFDNLKNMGAMMAQVREMKQKMAQAQAELASKAVEGESGAGLVRVRMNGKFEVLSVKLDQRMLASLVTPDANKQVAADDQKMIEDLVAAAFNSALQKAQELAAEEMSKVTGGLNLPGLDKLLGG